MDKQKLPLQILQYLKEVDDFIKSIKTDLEVSSGNGHLLLLKSKKYQTFFFNIMKWDIRNGKVIFSLEVYPYSLIGDVRTFEKEGSLIPSLEKWLSYLVEYDSIDISFFAPKLKPEINIYEEKDKVLPSCLKSLLISNFQGTKNTSITNIPVDTQWVFLVGENGFGKTTVLQSILLGLNGFRDGNEILVEGTDVTIEVEYKSEERSIINNGKENKEPFLHLAAYGPSRLNLQGDIDETEEERRSSVSYSLFKTNGNLLNINSEMYKWALKEDARFNLVKKAFCKLIPYLADVRYNKEKDNIEYIEKDVIDGLVTYEPLPYKKLASGFRAIIGIAGDMIIRLSRSQTDVLDPSELKGIVIIDELDLHWHPKLQKQIPKLFSSVFPKVQFIVSTHSPIPLLGAPHNSVILKVTRTKEEGVKIERVDVDLKYLTPNLILTSGIFDMDDVLSVENDDLTKTRTEDSFEEMKHNDEVDDYLAEFEKSNRQFPDELFEPKAN